VEFRKLKPIRAITFFKNEDLITLVLEAIFAAITVIIIGAWFGLLIYLIKRK
jgi:hypothetical protein